jgi:K+-transporting ATPase ATPase C chain
MTLVLCVITGVVYPGVVTGLAQLLFSRQANGSLVEVGGRVVGSELIGQPFSQPWYFHPRPSAAGAGYDATASSGTNKGPTDLKLADTLIAQAVDSAVALDGAVRGQVPADMATRSASGLDPHISPANALLQIARVARARGVRDEQLRQLVIQQVEGRQLRFFGAASHAYAHRRQCISAASNRSEIAMRGYSLTPSGADCPAAAVPARSRYHYALPSAASTATTPSTSTPLTQDCLACNPLHDAARAPRRVNINLALPRRAQRPGSGRCAKYGTSVHSNHFMS